MALVLLAGLQRRGRRTRRCNWPFATTSSCPREITVPAHTKIKLVVDNQDATAEEFESYELNREKVVAAKSKITVYVGPLEPGRYPFFGDFHKDSANGVLIAK